MKKSRVLFFLSLAIVVLGHPAWMPCLGFLAATLGFAVFWISISSECSIKKQNVLAFLWSLCVQLVHLSWIVSLKYQGYFIVVLCLLLCVGISMQFAIVTRLAVRSSQTVIKNAVLAGSAAVLLEWSRFFLSKYFGFTWNFWGLSLACYDITSQLSSLFGVLGLTYYVMFTNTYIYRLYIFKCFRFAWKSVVLVVFLPYLVGWWCFGVDSFFDQKNKKNITILLVQPAIYPSQKNLMKGMENEYISPYHQWGKVLSLLKPYTGQKVDLIVMPESVVGHSYDSGIYRYSDAKQFLAGIDPFFASIQVPEATPFVYAYENQEKRVSNSYYCQVLAEAFSCDVIAGFDCFDPVAKNHYNSAFLFQKDAKKVERHDKQKLLPVAEILPHKFFKVLAQKYGITEFFSPGDALTLLGEKFCISPSICFEETFPELVRQMNRKKADILVNISNDAWYPNTNLPKHHFHLGRMRAIESGIPLVRACNTGVTAVIDSRGRLCASIPSESWFDTAKAAAILCTVPLVKHFTLFSVWGDSGVVSISLISLVAMMCNKRRKA